MKKNTDHVVMDARTNAFTCTHCGQSYQPTMPAPIDMFVAMSNQFVITHGDCKPPPTIRHLPADDSEGGLP